MLIFRYLAKEVFLTLFALTAILLLIFLSNQFVQYLTRAANGQIPAMFILKLLMLELPNLLGLLLPLGFYVSILLAYGRLYAESEMTVLHACGYGVKSLLRDTLFMASVVALIVSVVVLYLSPDIAKERARLLRTTGAQMLIKTIMPERFQMLPGTHDVFYVESMNRAHTTAKGIFLARHQETEGQEMWQILWADKGETFVDKKQHEDYVALTSGHSYQGEPGSANYEVASFKRLETRLPHPEFTYKATDLRVMSTRDLWPLNNPSSLKEAELQWRISVPLMVFVLTLLAVPLSRVNPRSGKYASLLPAIVIFFLYANFMFIVRGWLVAERIPSWLGLWWLHLLFAALGGYLIFRQERLS